MASGLTPEQICNSKSWQTYSMEQKIDLLIELSVSMHRDYSDKFQGCQKIFIKRNHAITAFACIVGVLIGIGYLTLADIAKLKALIP